MDKAFDDNREYKAARKLLPSGIVKPFFSLDYPSESRDVGFVCIKKRTPNFKDMTCVDFSYSEKRNKELRPDKRDESFLQGIK